MIIGMQCVCVCVCTAAHGLLDRNTERTAAADTHSDFRLHTGLRFLQVNK